MTSLDISIDVSGLESMIAESLAKAERNARKAMEQAGDIVVEKAKQLAPDATGELRNSIGHTPATGSLAAGSLSVEIAAAADHASHVEYGTRAHDIVPRFRKALRFPSSLGGFGFAKKVRHPGTRPQPFMAPAADATRRDVEAEIRAAIALAFKE